MTLDTHRTLYAKINSKWIKDRNVRANTMKLFEENKEAFRALVLGNGLLGSTPAAQVPRERVGKSDTIRLKASVLCRTPSAK